VQPKQSGREIENSWYISAFLILHVYTID